jgi:hypothetical protein
MEGARRELARGDPARDGRVGDRVVLLVVLFLAGGICSPSEKLLRIGEPSGTPTTYQLSIKYRRLQSLIDSRDMAALGASGCDGAIHLSTADAGALMRAATPAP